MLLRVDINSPIDPTTGLIADETRLDKSLPTIRDLADGGARVTIIAHQGDTLDYHNLVTLREHAAKLSDKLGRPVGFIDDVAGPAARERIAGLGDGDILLLDNLRFLTEEVSTFEIGGQADAGGDDRDLSGAQPGPVVRRLRERCLRRRSSQRAVDGGVPGGLAVGRGAAPRGRGGRACRRWPMSLPDHAASCWEA